MLTTEQKQTFAEEGYFVFKELFPKALMEEIVHEAKFIANQIPHSYEEGALVGWDDSVFLPYPAFVKAVEYPLFEELWKSFGSDFRLITNKTTSALVLCFSSQKLYEWHRDPDIVNVPEFYPNQVYALIYLQDTTSAEVGYMRVLPGSHKSDYQLNHSGSSESIAGEVNLAFPSGTVIVCHENLWHIKSPNISGSDYWMLVLHYGRPKASLGKSLP